MLNIKETYRRLWGEIRKISQGKEVDPELLRDLIAYETNMTDRKTQDAHIARMIRLGFLVWDKDDDKISAVETPPLFQEEGK